MRLSTSWPLPAQHPPHQQRRTNQQPEQNQLSHPRICLSNGGRDEVAHVLVRHDARVAQLPRLVAREGFEERRRIARTNQFDR